MLPICGLQKTTLLDFPGLVACTIFLGGCNFSCPYCHNSELIHLNKNQIIYSESDVLNFLMKRQGILEGVCITGGEPTLSPTLPAFIKKVKALGFQVKLDTNGSNPDMLKHLVNENIIDYIAMDIKNSIVNYAKTIGGLSASLDNIISSINYIKSLNIPYEFRTTLVAELHTEEDIISIGRLLEGNSRFYLQNYKDSEQVLHRVYSPVSTKQAEYYLSLLKPYVPNSTLRGIDDNL